MPDSSNVNSEMQAAFGGDQPPAVFARLQANEAYLSAVWAQYQAVMGTGELDRTTKELLGLAVAVAKSNGYMIGLQKAQLAKAGLGEAELLEALAVASFFEGFDAFAHALRVDSDLRPRKLEAGDMSAIDREVDVNVPYVIDSDDPVVAEVYSQIRARMGIPFIPNIFKALAHQPAMLRAKWESYKAIMGKGRLRRLTKELIAVAVSGINGCYY